MAEKLLLIKVNDGYAYLDYDGYSFGDRDCLQNSEYIIDLHEIFGISDKLNLISGITIVYCTERKDGITYAGAIFKNANIYKYGQYYDPYLESYSVRSKSSDVFVIPENKLSFRIDFEGNYIYTENEHLSRYIERMAIDEYCIKFDDSIIENGLKEAGDDIDKLGDLYDRVWCLFQTKKAIPVMEKLYSLSKATNVANAYIDLLRYSGKQKQALKMASELYEKEPNDTTLVYMALCNGDMNFNTEMMALLEKVKDKSIFKDMNVDYEYLKKSMPYINNTEYIDECEILKHGVALSFDTMPLPDTVKVDGVRKYFDPVRKKGVPITSEEKVRQQVLRYLIDVCGVPVDNITSEDSLAHYDRGNVLRADITVNVNGNTLLLVECKENGKGIDGAPLHQILGYNRILRSRYLLLTNGICSYIYYCNDDGTVKPLNDLPSFEEMCKQANSPVSVDKIITKRPDVSEFTHDEIKYYKDDGRYLGADTPESLCSAALNLAWLFLDSEYRIEGIKGYGVSIEKDLGAINTILTNASGGKFDGQYRQLLVRDRFGQEQLVCFSVWGTTSGYTSLVCGIEIGSQLIAKLEARIDVCLKQKKNGKFVLTHNGVRSRKTTASMLRYVKAECPELMYGNEIFLGEFDNSKNITMDLPEVKDFMLRLVSYLILRKELSVIEKQKG